MGHSGLLQGHQWVVVPEGEWGADHGQTAWVTCALSRLTPALFADLQEPPWVEVMVEILLSLLAQPSHLMRQVARSVFSHICSHLTLRALQLILDVSGGLWGRGSQDGALRAQGCTRATASLLAPAWLEGGDLLQSLLLCTPDSGSGLSRILEGMAFSPRLHFPP